MKSYLDESEAPPGYPILKPKEQKLKDAVIKAFMRKYASKSASFKARGIKRIEERISTFFPAICDHIPTHPPYQKMVREAIKELNEEGGSNLDEISIYIERNFQGLPFAHPDFLKKYIIEMVDSGEILLFSNGRHSLPDLACQPNLGHVGKQLQHQQQQEKKRRRGRPTRVQVKQQRTVEQHHKKSACAKPVLETGKGRAQGKPRKMDATTPQEGVEVLDHIAKCKPAVGVEVVSNRLVVCLRSLSKIGDGIPVDEIEEGTSEQHLQSKGLRRIPRNMDLLEEKIIEQHQQKQWLKLKTGTQGETSSRKITQETVEESSTLAAFVRTITTTSRHV